MDVNNVEYEFLPGYEKIIELTEYEKTQIKEIKKWKNEKPSVIGRTINIATMPFAWAAKKVIPEKIFLGALNLGNQVSKIKIDKKEILKTAQIEDIKSLKNGNLMICDGLADKVHNDAIKLAALEGGGTGLMGIGGIALDIPALITLALRTINKIGMCYGYEEHTKEYREFCLAILSAASSNTLEEKAAALSFLKSMESFGVKKSLKGFIAKSIKNKIAKEASSIYSKNLSKQIGANLTKRKSLSLVPVIGAVVGGSMNAWYIRDVGWCARRAFQERWLLDNEKIDIEDVYGSIL